MELRGEEGVLEEGEEAGAACDRGAASESKGRKRESLRTGLGPFEEARDDATVGLHGEYEQPSLTERFTTRPKRKEVRASGGRTSRMTYQGSVRKAAVSVRGLRTLPTQWCVQFWS